MKAILYLALSSFSQTGGIEKVNRAWLHALDIFRAEKKMRLQVNVMLDTLPDTKYIAKNSFRGFSGNKLAFTLSSITKSLKSDVLILSHINLALIGFIFKILKPSGRLIIHAHGIEVWRPLSFIKKKALLNADSIIAVSAFTKNQLIEIQGIASDKITVLANSLDPYFPITGDLDKPDYLQERYGIQEKSVLLTLARLSSSEQYKGYDKVIKLLPELLKINPSIIYLIGGKSDETEKQRIESLIKSSQTENHVRLLGFIADEELIDHYKLADAFIMPSEGEGFGICFIEAGACGTPSIGGNRDGSPDAIIAGQTGVLCDPRNAEATQEAILALLSQEQDPKAIRNYTVQKYSFREYLKKIENLVAA